MAEKPCPFCLPSADRVLFESSLALALSDGFPVSAGHSLVVPRRHAASFFELTSEEQGEMLQLLRKTQELCTQLHHPDGFNIGVNDGRSAGQTVMHVHMHLISAGVDTWTTPTGFSGIVDDCANIDPLLPCARDRLPSR